MTQPEPNEYNGLTRYDTYNIRPDLFESLKNTKAAQSAALFEALSGAGADAEKVTSDLEKLNTQLQEHGEKAPGGLIPAYIAANTRRWELQAKIDEAQNGLLRVQAEAQDMLAQKTAEDLKNIHAVVDSLRDSQAAQLQSQSQYFAVGNVYRGASNEFWDYEYFQIPFHFTARFTAKSSWRGKVLYQYARTSSSGQQIFTGEWYVPDSDGSRVREFDMGTNAFDWIYITFMVEKGTQKTRDFGGGRTDTAPNVWTKHDNQAFTAKTTGKHAIYWEVTWDATTFHNRFGLRVTTSKGRTLDQLGPVTKVGPLLPGYDGARTQYLQLSDVSLDADEQVFFETFTDASEASQRVVRSTLTKLSWVEGA